MIISGVALIRDTGCNSSTASCAAGYIAPAPTWPVQLRVRRVKPSGAACAGRAPPMPAPAPVHGLDDHGLAERHPHALAQDARERFRRPARRERHDHGDGMRWIALRISAAA